MERPENDPNVFNDEETHDYHTRITRHFIAMCENDINVAPSKGWQFSPMKMRCYNIAIARGRMWLNGQITRPSECLFCSGVEYIPEEENLPIDEFFYHCNRNDHIELAHAVWSF